MARPRRRREGCRGRVEGARRVPDPRGSAGVLRRLQRDGAVRRRGLRVGVRDMMLEPNPLTSLPQYTDEELADLNREFENLPAAKIIQWAVDNYAPHLCLS